MSALDAGELTKVWGKVERIPLIPVMRPRLAPLAPAFERMERIWEAGVFSNSGPFVKEFEQTAEIFLGAPEGSVVSVANATLGISASALALGADQWLLPSWTFTASPAALVLAGKSLYFGDISPDSQQLDISALDETFDGVLTVAPFGFPISKPDLPRSTALIVDAAASLGTAEKSLEDLRENGIIVFSLHATKVLGIGEGGLIVCGSPELASEVRSILNFGFDSGRNSDRLGFNGKMSEVAGAIALNVFSDWEAEKQDWLSAREVVRVLSRELALPSFDPGGQWVAPYWIVQFEDSSKAVLAESLLRESDIETRRWWGQGCHKMIAYAGIPRRDLQKTELVAHGNIGLPFFRGFGDREANAVFEALTGKL